MQGYYNKPVETAQTLERDAEGRVWLHTGDIGHFDEDGFLYITDRKKDLLKTSGGKYIAPQPIESAIKESRFVNQVVVIGDERKFPAALIVPRMDQLISYAKHKGIHTTSPQNCSQTHGSSTFSSGRLNGTLRSLRNTRRSKRWRCYQTN